MQRADICSTSNDNLARHVRVLATCLAAAFLFAASAAAQEPDQRTLRARVLDPTGTAVAGARVEVVRTRGDDPRIATTDADGTFSVDGLSAASYQVTVTSPRWTPIVAIVDLAAPADELRSFRFRSLALDENVTVSATGTARDTLAVPGEVSVIEREAFDRTQARGLDDVLRYEPGIDMGSTRRLMETPTIRGFDASRVLVLRDGARVSQFTSAHKGALFLEVNDVERIEVVRGPASALYGSGALGGVLSITSPDPVDLLAPDQAVGASFSSTYSSAYDELMFHPRAYGATSGGVGFVLGYTGRRNDGLVKTGGDAGPLDYAEEDVDAFDARLVAPIGRTGRLRVSYNDYRQDGRSSINLADSVVEPDEQVNRSTRQRSFLVAYDGAGDAWWGENVAASVYYSETGLDETRPVDGRADRIELATWGFDARNTVTLGAAHSLTYGVEGFRDRETSARDDAVNHLFPPGRQTQVGLYAQDEISVWRGRWVLVPGVRWDRWTSSSDDATTAARSDSRLNPKVGTSLEIVPGLVATAGYAEGFRTPSFQELFISGTHFRVPLGPRATLLGLFIPNPDLAPEASRNVDVGLRFRNRGLSARVAWYHAWVDDFIDFDVTEGFRPPSIVLLTFTNRNVKEATLYGLEGALRWDIDLRWTVRASYSKPRGADALTGEALGSVPPARTVVGGEFRDPGLGLRLGADARIVGEHERVPEGVEPAPGYALFDVRSAWTPAFWPAATLRFNVANVGNRAYRVPLFGTPGTGRDFRFGITVRFGQ